MCNGLYKHSQNNKASIWVVVLIDNSLYSLDVRQQFAHVLNGYTKFVEKT